MTEGREQDLRALVEQALALADAQGLPDVAIGLDQARVALLGIKHGPATQEEIDRLLDSAA